MKLRRFYEYGEDEIEARRRTMLICPIPDIDPPTVASYSALYCLSILLIFGELSGVSVIYKHFYSAVVAVAIHASIPYLYMRHLRSRHDKEFLNQLLEVRLERKMAEDENDDE